MISSKSEERRAYRPGAIIAGKSSGSAVRYAGSVTIASEHARRIRGESSRRLERAPRLARVVARASRELRALQRRRAGRRVGVRRHGRAPRHRRGQLHLRGAQRCAPARHPRADARRAPARRREPRVSHEADAPPLPGHAALPEGPAEHLAPGEQRARGLRRRAHPAGSDRDRRHRRRRGVRQALQQAGLRLRPGARRLVPLGRRRMGGHAGPRDLRAALLRHRHALPRRQRARGHRRPVRAHVPLGASLRHARARCRSRARLGGMPCTETETARGISVAPFRRGERSPSPAMRSATRLLLALLLLPALAPRAFPADLDPRPGTATARAACLVGGGSTAPFACLAGRGPLVTLRGTRTSEYSNRSLAPGTRIDARGATFLASSSTRYPISLDGGADVCLAGGTVRGQYDRTPDWATMHDMNNAGAAFASPTTVDGIRVDDVTDGLRPRGIGPFTIRNAWLSYIRDDCVEDDHVEGGLIDDSLFDGCYVAISERPSAAIGGQGGGQLLTIRRSLLRLEPMPGPRNGSRGELGNGEFFKWSDRATALALYDNVFMAEKVGQGGPDTMGVPRPLAGCARNMMVWLGPGEYPAPLPACFRVTRDRAVS